MDKLSDWLSHNLPTNDNEMSLVHGDFRIDNLIFHPTEVLILDMYLLSFKSFFFFYVSPKLHLFEKKERKIMII